MKPAKNSRINKCLPLFFLTLVLFFHGVNNYFWLKNDVGEGVNDSSGNVSIVLSLYSTFKNTEPVVYPDGWYLGYLGKSKLKAILSTLKYRWEHHLPPFYFICSVIFNLIFGVSYVSSMMVNILFLGILLVSVYLLGKEMLNKEAGLVAAFILSFYPIVFGMTRVMKNDLAMTSFICLSLYFLLKSKGFTKLGFSILLGISVGIGLLLQFVFLLFFMPIFVWYLLKYIKDILDRKSIKDLKIVLLGIVVCFACVLVIASIYYNKNHITTIKDVYLHFVMHSDSNVSNPLRKNITLGIRNFNYYFLRIVRAQLSPIMFLSLCATSIFFFISKAKYRTMFLIWVAIPYIFFSLLCASKYDRYLLPTLPALAVITGMGFSRIKNKILKLVIGAIVIIISVLQYYDISYGSDLMHTYHLDFVKRKSMSIETVAWDRNIGNREEFYLIESAANLISEVIDRRQQERSFIYFSNAEAFGNIEQRIIFYTLKKRLPITIIHSQGNDYFKQQLLNDKVIAIIFGSDSDNLSKSMLGRILFDKEDGLSKERTLWNYLDKFSVNKIFFPQHKRFLYICCLVN